MPRDGYENLATAGVHADVTAMTPGEGVEGSAGRLGTTLSARPKAPVVIVRLQWECDYHSPRLNQPPVADGVVCDGAFTLNTASEGWRQRAHSLRTCYHRRRANRLAPT